MEGGEHGRFAGCEVGKLESQPLRRRDGEEVPAAGVAAAVGCSHGDLQPPAGYRVDVTFGDVEVLGAPPLAYQRNAGPVRPHVAGRGGQLPLYADPAADGPPWIARSLGALAVDRGDVPLERLICRVRGAERIEPLAQLPEGLAAQRVDAALAEGMHRDQARVLQGLQVLGHLGLAKPEFGGDLTDPAWRPAKELHDPQPVALSKRCEDDVIHETKYPPPYIFSAENTSCQQEVSRWDRLAPGAEGWVRREPSPAAQPGGTSDESGNRRIFDVTRRLRR